jgi:hypothetical protein
MAGNEIAETKNKPPRMVSNIDTVASVPLNES